MKLTKNFSDFEFLKKEKSGEITDHDIAKAIMLCKLVLQPARGYLGEAVTITSGKRSPQHNASVGGSKRSDHLYVRDSVAADFTTRQLVRAFEFIINVCMDVVGQLIIYPDRNFIHVSLSTYRHTGEIMINKDGKYIKYTDPEQLAKYFRS